LTPGRTESPRRSSPAACCSRTTTTPSRPASTRGSHWREDYFDESPIADVGWKHFDLPGEPAQEQKYERFWRLGQIVTAVAGAGLTIRSLEEFSTIYETYWRAKDPRVPGQFVLIATKPKEGAKAAKTPRRAPRP
jgi:hypothetical protein